MLNPGDITLHADRYEFMTDADKTVVGLRFTVKDGYSPTLKTVTVPIDPDAALEIGAQLIAHSDWLKGREPRDWSKLTD